MAYRTIKSWTGAIPVAGQFPATQVPFNSNPSDGDTIQITFNGVTRVYGFKSNGGAAAHFVSSPTSACQIGSNTKQTIINLINTINTNPHDTQVGTDGTISPVLSGDNMFIVYGNNKIVTGPTISDPIGSFLGSNATHQTGVAVAHAYGMQSSYSDVYSAISFNSGNTHQILVVDNPNDDGYNAGPPKSNLKVVTVALAPNVIHEITTLGCSTSCTLYG